MGMVVSQITSLTIVCSTIYWGTGQRINRSSASLAFVREIHRSPVNFLHKWPVRRKMFPFDDVIMTSRFFFSKMKGWYFFTCLSACLLDISVTMKVIITWLDLHLSVYKISAHVKLKNGNKKTFGKCVCSEEWNCACRHTKAGKQMSGWWIMN